MRAPSSNGHAFDRRPFCFSKPCILAYPDCSPIASDLRQCGWPSMAVLAGLAVLAVRAVVFAVAAGNARACPCSEGGGEGRGRKGEGGCRGTCPRCSIPIPPSPAKLPQSVARSAGPLNRMMSTRYADGQRTSVAALLQVRGTRQRPPVQQQRVGESLPEG